MILRDFSFSENTTCSKINSQNLWKSLKISHRFSESLRNELPIGAAFWLKLPTCGGAQADMTSAQPLCAPTNAIITPHMRFFPPIGFVRLTHVFVENNNNGIQYTRITSVQNHGYGNNIKSFRTAYFRKVEHWTYHTTLRLLCNNTSNTLLTTCVSENGD